MFIADALYTLMLNINVPKYQVTKSIILGGGEPNAPHVFYYTRIVFIATELKREK